MVSVACVFLSILWAFSTFQASPADLCLLIILEMLHTFQGRNHHVSEMAPLWTIRPQTLQERPPRSLNTGTR